MATDGSEDAKLAARAAIDLSDRTGAQLHVAHAWQAVPPPVIIPEYYEEEGRRVLEEQAKLVADAGGMVREVHLLMGPPVHPVLDLGKEIEADLIVVGSRGHGPIGRLLLGSVSEGVVHYATRPVLGLRGGEDAWPPGRVVIGDDGSETARKAAELAVSIGKLCGARGALVRAYAEMPEIDAGGRISDPRLVDDALRRAERELEKHAEKLERTLGMRPRVEVAVGDAAAALLEKAREEGETSTLIVVGRRGLGLAKRLRMGSASTKVLRAAEGPVLGHPGAGRAML